KKKELGHHCSAPTLRETFTIESNNLHRAQSESGRDSRGRPPTSHAASAHVHRRYGYLQRNRSPTRCGATDNDSTPPPGSPPGTSAIHTASAVAPSPGPGS